MNDAFENILGQPKVRDYLRTAVTAEKVTHAYLFVGPAGSHKMLAALSFSQALLCPKGAKGPRGGECGACDACGKVRRRKHPDVRVFEPEGAQGYLLEQVRDIVGDASLAPIQADRKIYIVDRADLLSVQAANAFLKTLEEPPDNVTFILLARSREGVLPTVSSRCQIVPFRTIPSQEACGIVVQNSGANPEQAAFALAACDGSLTKAVAFLSSHKSMELRGRLFGLLERLRQADDWDVIEGVRVLLDLSRAPTDELRSRQEQELAKNQDFLAKSAIRQIEARNKRALTAQTIESLSRIVALSRSWVRDVMAVCEGASELVVNVDVADALADAASHTSAARAARALVDIDASAQALAYNVSPETCIDALMFDVRDRLYR
ncbi:ATP-binding protein [Xiamenia xianingshaonis]|uniref:DNA polymerase III subunit delta n=1 Tax=Xiamenia xianingshaonis TaxID=2682776 RepID=A0A9E6MPE9_9ACTN|nr:DNA polymerase III subunit delta' [Xiamenia xianingshaonis]NHM13969.1 DNA polymerase III subunit delta [Xiamenia xianingshaonis]QTU83846.1 DNA polymerase III subunit delta' [Xiamenia xianingshaonis]